MTPPAVVVGPPHRQGGRRLLRAVSGLGAFAGVGVLSALLATAATAATVGPVSGSVPTTLTDWSTTVSVPKFNPATGTLTRIDCTLTGTVSGADGYENRSTTSPAPSIQLNLKASITLTRPDTTTLGAVLPLAQTTDVAVPVYDGVTDFGGTSGKTYTGLTDTASTTFSLTSAADLALFSGAGSVALPINALGVSNAVANGNVSTFFDTSASALVSCTYTYTPAVDLSITKSSPALVSGSTATYQLAVTNNGPSATAGTTTVSDTLPAGLTFASGSGGGYSCSAAGQVVTCTHPSTVSSGASGTISLVVNVTGAAGSSISNTATVSGAGSNDPTPGNNSATAGPTTVTGISDLGIVKTLTNASLPQGGTATYSLVVSNAGPSATTGTTTVTDVLPAGLSFVSGTGGGFSCAAVGQTVTCTRSTALASGGSATIALATTVNGALGSSITNTASVGNPASNDPNAANDTDADTHTVTEVHDLGITKTISGALVAGQNGTYTLAYVNNGPSATTGTTTVTDVLPAGLSFVSGTGGGFSCTAAGQTVTCTHAATIADGGSGTITLTVAVGSGATGSITNTASIATAAGTDPTPANNTDTDTSTVGASSDLSLTKTHVGSFSVGQNGTFTLTVTNNGPSATSGTTTVTDTLPAGLTFVSGSGGGFSCSAAGQSVTCTRPTSLTNGGTGAITLTVSVGAAAAPGVTNTATVANAGDPVAGNNSDSDPVTVNPVSDLAVVKVLPGSLPSGGTGTYTLTVTNNGPSPTSGTTTVIDVLPAGLTFVSGTGGSFSCAAAGQTVTCTRATALTSGGTAAIALTVNVASAPGTSLSNTATVSNPGANDPTPGNNSSTAGPTTVTEVHDLGITKTISGALVAGQNGTYTLAYVNNGPSATTGTTTVTDVLPAGLSFVSGTGGGFSCTAAGQTVTCTHAATIADGGSGTITLTVAVGSGATGSITNTASIATAAGTDPTPANNSSTVTSSIGTVVDVAITASSSVLTAGSPGTYTLTIANNGPSATGGTTTVTDTLPAGVTFVSGSGGAFSCAAAGQTVTCTRPTSLANGGTAVITLNVTVASSATGTLVDTASVSSPGDSNPANNNASVASPLAYSSDLGVTKVVGGQLVSGADGTYTFSVTNVGPSDTGTSPTTVTDVLPAGLRFLSGSGGGFTCSAAGQTVTCTRSTSLTSGGSATVTVTVNVTAAGGSSVTNTATVAGGNPDPNAANDSSTAGPTTVRTVSDLSLAKTSGSLVAGRDGSYTLTITNGGPSATAGTSTVTDTLPAGVAFVSGSGGGFTCSAVGQTVTCTRSASIANAGTAVITLNVTVGSGETGPVTNTAAVSNPDDPVAGNNTGTVTTPVTSPPTIPVDTAVDVSIALTSSALTAGSPGVYTMTVTNNGPSPTNGSTTVTNTLPAGVRFLSGSGGGFTCSAAGQVVTCTRPASLANAEIAVLTLDVTVAPSATGTLVDTANVTTAGDSNPANNDASVSTPLGTTSDLSITNVLDAPLVAGTSGTYTVTVTSNGPADSAGTATVTETLPAGLTFVSGTGGGFTCTAAGQVVTCTNPGPIVNGAAATLTLTVSVDSPAPASVAVTATVSNANDSNPANNTATAASGQIAGAALGDTVFRDLNGNGIQDAGDPGVPAVTVTLFRVGTATPVATTTTGANGTYAFTGLAAGDYYVVFSLPSGLGFTVDNAAGSTEANDSDADPGTGRTAPVALSVGTTYGDLDAGLVALDGAVSGTVYVDHNNNGTQDASEAGIGGVTVTLSGVDGLGNSVSRTTITAADGSWSFTGLRPGTYSVAETQPGSYLDGRDALGTAGGTLGNDTASRIVLPAGGIITGAGYDFGELRPASLGDTVFGDSNRNGIQDAGEGGVVGVTVTLTGSDDLGKAVTVTTTTDAQGRYRFTGLRPGSYALTFSGLPTGSTFATRGAGNDPARDSNADPSTGMASAVTLAEGENNPTIDAGIIATGSVVVTVTGLPGSGAGIPVTVIGTGTNGQPVRVAVVTGPGGTVTVPNLPPGEFTVTVNGKTVPAAVTAGAATPVTLSFGPATVRPGASPGARTLPVTGQDTESALRTGLLLLLGGGALLQLGRRRRTDLGA